MTGNSDAGENEAREGLSLQSGERRLGEVEKGRGILSSGTQRNFTSAVVLEALCSPVAPLNPCNLFADHEQMSIILAVHFPVISNRERSVGGAQGFF